MRPGSRDNLSKTYGTPQQENKGTGDKGYKSHSFGKYIDEAADV